MKISPARKTYYRISSDFFMGSRLDEYRRLLSFALDRGYRSVTVREAVAELARSGGMGPSDLWLIVRHDIDTDPVTARLMFQIERELGVVGTFYFRLSTVDVRLMREIEEGGGEASYHYEELATVSKRRGLARGQAQEAVEEARGLFVRNLEWLRSRTGLEMSTVASHGDFENRYLGVSNTVLLADLALRRQTGIRHEAYDAALMDLVGARFSDEGAPRFWVSGSPESALEQRIPFMYLLVHPRHWRSNIPVNLRDDVARTVDGLSCRLRRSYRQTRRWLAKQRQSEVRRPDKV
jgi:hypothetical protein